MNDEKNNQRLDKNIGRVPHLDKHMPHPDNTHVIGYELPQVYPLERIYDPDKHKEQEGYFIPSVDSIVVETIKGTNIRRLYTVLAVDPKTHKSTIGPATIINIADSETRLLGYGNETCMLYYDLRTSKTRLVIDNKITIYGGNSKEYKLIRIDENGNRIPISLYIDSHGNIKGVLVPIVDTGIPGIKKPLNCHTLYDMWPGETIIMEIYNASGVMTAEVNLISKEALILTDFEKEANPITKFDATANQTDGSNWALYVGQNVDALTIWPKITFQDGQEHSVPIDNKSCFIYGLKDVRTSIPGIEYKVMLKYFLSDRMITTDHSGIKNRYLLYEQVIRILAKSLHNFAKISLIPTWSSTLEKWKLEFVAYYMNRESYDIIPDNRIEYESQVFDGKLFDVWQNLVFIVKMTTGTGKVVEFKQSASIMVNPVTNDQKYLIAETQESEHIYGREDETHKRPYIYYDKSKELYFISSTKFNTKEIFIDNFYTQADPPYNKDIEDKPPVPTHFTIRDRTNGRVIIADAVEIAKYNSLMDFLTEGPKDRYLGNTVLVEFLKETVSQYEVIYSVPVEVIAADHKPPY